MPNSTNRSLNLTTRLVRQTLAKVTLLKAMRESTLALIMLAILTPPGLCLEEESQWRSHYDEGHAAFASKDYPAAEKAFVLAMADCENDSDSEHFISTLTDLDKTYRAEGKLQEAESLYKTALAGKLLSDANANRSTALKSLAELYCKSLNFPEAESALSASLEIDQKVGDERVLASDLTRLAKIYSDNRFQRSKFDQAEILYKRALSIRDTIQSEPQELSLALKNLANYYIKGSQFWKAEPLMTHALKIDEKEFGKQNQTVTEDLRTVALLNAGQQEIAAAEALIKRAIAVDKTLANSRGEAADYVMLARVSADKKEYEKAEEYARKALDTLKNQPEAGADQIATAMYELALMYVKAGHFPQAKELVARAKAINGCSTHEVASAINTLGAAYLAVDQPNEAEQLFRLAIAIAADILGRENLRNQEAAERLSVPVFGANLDVAIKRQLSASKDQGADGDSVR